MCACATFYVDNAVALAVMGKCVHHYLLLNVLLTCFVAWSAAADGEFCAVLMVRVLCNHNVTSY